MALIVLCVCARVVCDPCWSVGRYFGRYATRRQCMAVCSPTSSRKNSPTHPFRSFPQATLTGTPSTSRSLIAASWSKSSKCTFLVDWLSSSPDVLSSHPPSIFLCSTETDVPPCLPFAPGLLPSRSPAPFLSPCRGKRSTKRETTNGRVSAEFVP